MINENNPGFSLPETVLSWNHFVNNGTLGPYPVRSAILESWQRCRSKAVNPWDGKSNDLLNTQELHALLEKRADLLRVAHPLMERLYRFVAGSGFLVMLTDERGYIMETIGDEQVLDDALGLNFFPGARWTEEEVGTNAIGTGIILRKPIQILGAEHYCEKHHLWTCSGSPIFDRQGKMIGCLDVSGPCQLNHLHSLGMVVAATEAIMDQMDLELKNRELQIMNEQLGSIFHTMSDGVILVDKNGIITQINPVAQNIWGDSVTTSVGLSLEEVVGSPNLHVQKILGGEEYTDMEMIIDRDNRRVHCVVSSKPLHAPDGSLDGVVILVRSMDKVERLINRFGGTQAPFHFNDIIGISPHLAEVSRTAAMAARGSSNILLQGESGTGKEMVAQAIHNGSNRRRGPFVALNCGAIPRELVASELFGYVEGAFTGACRGGRPGKFELASGGTLFLDEIADMPLEQQVALLRVLQQKEITRIGSSKVIPVDVRVICAANRDLRREVANGNFRQDLFYRLNVISITIPPLRERREDIRVLFEHFLVRMGWDRGIGPDRIDPEVLRCIQHYDWPGNVRELQNVVERLVNIVNGSVIRLEHLPADLVRNRDMVNENSKNLVLEAKKGKVSNLTTLRNLKTEKEREYILEVLRQHEGNITQAAKELGVSRNTLYRKLHSYQMET